MAMNFRVSKSEEVFIFHWAAIHCNAQPQNTYVSTEPASTTFQCSSHYHRSAAVQLTQLNRSVEVIGIDILIDSFTKIDSRMIKVDRLRISNMESDLNCYKDLIGYRTKDPRQSLVRERPSRRDGLWYRGSGLGKRNISLKINPFTGPEWFGGFQEVNRLAPELFF